MDIQTNRGIFKGIPEPKKSAPHKRQSVGGARPGAGAPKKPAGPGASKYVINRRAEEAAEAVRQLAVPKEVKASLPHVDVAEVAIAFAHDVVEGRIVAGQLEKRACERFIRDLDRADLAFNREAAQKIGDYAREVKLELLGWECFILANLFGFKRLDGPRRFNFAYIELGRKNGKSTLLALIILYMADSGGDGEEKAECYIAATTRYQSRDIVFKSCLRLRDQNPDVSFRSTAFRTTVVFDNESVIEPKAANADKLAGLNIHCGILDELGDHPNADLLNVFQSGTVGRRQPLTLCITTAGKQRDLNVAWAQRQYGLQILDTSVKDDTVFIFICCPDGKSDKTAASDDPWDTEETFRKGNPSFGVLVDSAQVRAQCEKARKSMTDQISFKRFNLNIWPETTYVDSWFAYADLQKPGVAYLPGGEKLEAKERIAKRLEVFMRDGRACRAGLDLGLVSDLSVLAAVFAIDDRYEIIARKFMPIDCDLAKREPFKSWIADKWIETTPGSFTDFQFIEEAIYWFRDNVAMAELCFDKALAPDLVSRVADRGIPVVEVRQGYALSPAILRIEKLIKEAKLALHGDPVLSWCFSNVVLETGAKGDFRFARHKSRDKIDAAVATTIAIEGWMNSGTLPYDESRGVLTV